MATIPMPTATSSSLDHSDSGSRPSTASQTSLDPLQMRALAR